MKFHVHSDIKKAATLPASFYKDLTIFEAIKERIYLKSWQWVGDESAVPFEQSVHPFVLLDGYLTEPMLLTKNKENEINCLTNVCTHRGNLVAINSGK